MKRKLIAGAEYSLANENENFVSEEEEQNKRKKKENIISLMNDFEKEEIEKEKEKKVFYKQRVLILCSRGATNRFRHLMQDLRTLLPHSKKESKLDDKEHISVLNEMCELKSCSSCIYFEIRKKQDCYMWISKTPNGPCVKFLLENDHTLGEMKMTGNCLKGSRPIVVFDKAFEDKPIWKLLRELLSQTFSTPKGHPKSKPFVDHVFSFFIQDGRIWFRNYQIVRSGKANEEVELVEIGPRFVLNPIKVFEGSFGGPVIYQNANYVSPNEVRSNTKLEDSKISLERSLSSIVSEDRRKGILKEVVKDQLADVFDE